MSASAQRPSNLVRNFGFEDNLNQGWQVDPAQLAKGIAYRTTTARTGQYALRLYPNRLNAPVAGRADFGVLQSFPVEGRRGKPLYFEAWINARGDVTAVVQLAVLTAGGQVIFRELAQGPVSGDQNRFTFRRDILDIPDDPNIIALFVACAVKGTSGAATFDDVVVSDDPSVTTWRVGQRDPGPPLEASIAVIPDAVIRTIPPNFYGMNIEWVLGGQGLYAGTIDDLDPTLVAMAKAAGVNSFRFPGGLFANYYRWKDGVGPRKERKVVRPGPVDFITPHDFGTDEAIALSERAGGSLLITANVLTGTAEEAADWVRYVNKDKRRAEYWEVGNEIYLEYPTDPDSPPTADSPRSRTSPQEYAAKFVEFSKAMKAADPSIKVGADVEFNVSVSAFRLFPNWAQVVLQRAAPQIDFLSVHNGLAPGIGGDGGWDVRTVYSAMMASPVLLQRSLRQLSDLIDKEAGPHASRIQIGMTEWGPLFDTSLASRFADHTQTLASALYTASALKVLVEEPRVVLTSGFKLNDASTQGWIGLRNRQWAAKAPFTAFGLFTKHFLNNVVRTSVNSPTFATRSIGWSDAQLDVPFVEATASIGDGGNAMTVVIINKHFDRAANTTVFLGSFVAETGGKVYTMSGESIDANPGVHTSVLQAKQSVDERYDDGGPGEIWTRTSELDAGGSTLTLQVPARSITVITLNGHMAQPATNFP